MNRRGGHEMRSFLLLVTALVVLLMEVAILFTTLDSIRRINQEAEREKEGVTEALVDYLAASAEASLSLQRDPIIMSVLSQEMMASFARGDMSMLSEFLTAILRPIYDAEYVVVVIDGKVVAESVRKGLEIGEYPTTMPGQGEEVTWEVLDSLGDRQGYFVSFYRPFTIPGVEGFLHFVLDRTEQVKGIEARYDEEKSDLVARQLIIGAIYILLAILISMLGVRLLARRYITGPIEELSDISHRIMEGTFEGDLEVVEESDYADLQRLLQSGEVLMGKMMEHQGET